MLKKIIIKSFKSLEQVEVDLGSVNVFIGANGSGKSNLLEALGVLSAAAAGRVDDEALRRRGVRPTAPRLYKCALIRARQSPHIVLAAEEDSATYKVSLFPSLNGTKSTWRYHTESWVGEGRKLAVRSHSMKARINPEAGLAALRAVELPEGDPALTVLDILRNYVIYEPNTPALRGLVPEQQPREPVGLSGGGLAQAIRSLIGAARRDERTDEQFEAFCDLIDWAQSIDSASHISGSPAISSDVVRFKDRFMKRGANTLSGADASEGAMYVLFNAVLALDERAPRLLAIDNADHGLNPRLAQALIGRICEAVLSARMPQQLLLTTHSPQALDGLPLRNDRIRLFTVSRTNTGRTAVCRVELNEKLLRMAKEGWTLSRLWVMGHLGGVPNV